MRAAYLISGLVVAALVIFNVPRLPWITAAEIGAVGPFRGFAHGMIGMSYMGSWVLIIGGLYQLILGVVYWDMDTTEAERWAFTMDSGGTAKLLFVMGALCLAGGIAWVVFAYSHSSQQASSAPRVLAAVAGFPADGAGRHRPRIDGRLNWRSGPPARLWKAQPRYSVRINNP